MRSWHTGRCSGGRAEEQLRRNRFRVIIDYGRWIPMSPELERMAEELLQLPAASRAELAARLIASLEENRDENADTLWLEQAKRRLEEVESGQVSPKPAEEVFRNGRAIF